MLTATRNFNRLLDFGLKSMKRSAVPTFLKEEHRCPKCNKAVVDYGEYVYMKEMGECGTHDHVEGELISDLRGGDAQ